jgi:hypothetical protein
MYEYEQNWKCVAAALCFPDVFFWQTDFAFSTLQVKKFL